VEALHLKQQQELYFGNGSLGSGSGTSGVYANVVCGVGACSVGSAVSVLYSRCGKAVFCHDE
jgi:hypothetical protein